MPSTLQHLQVPKLGGGVNDYDTVYEMFETQMQNSSYNIRSFGDAYGPRPGYITVFDTLTGGDKVAHLGAYYRNSDANDRLIAVYNNKIYDVDTENETVWTDLVVGAKLTSDASVNTVTFRDDLFIFNGVDKPIRWDGTTFTNDFTHPDELTANTFIPKFGTICFNGSLVVAGVPNNENMLWFSKASTAANPEYVYDFSGGLSTTGDADKVALDHRVTALQTLPSGLVVFTNTGGMFIPGFVDNGAGILVPEQRPIDNITGAVSQKSTVVVEQDVFYLTPEKEIRSMRRDFNADKSVKTNSLSVNVQEYLNTQIDDDLSNAWAVYDPIKKLCKFHFKPKDGTIINNVIVFDMNKIDVNGNPEIYIDNGKPFSCGVFFKKKLYTGCEVLGQVYEDEVGGADDDDAPIATQRVSKFFTMGNAVFYKTMRNWAVEGELGSPSEITVSIYVDEVLVDQQVITIDDVEDTSGLTLSGGIGTLPIATFPIGTSSGTDTDPTERNAFVKRNGIRIRGKNIAVVTTTNQVNQNWRIRQYTLGFISVPTTWSPLTDQ